MSAVNATWIDCLKARRGRGNTKCPKKICRRGPRGARFTLLLFNHGTLNPHYLEFASNGREFQSSAIKPRETYWYSAEVRNCAVIIRSRRSQLAIWLRATASALSLLCAHTVFGDDSVEIVLQDGAAQPPWDGEMGAYDEAIDYDVCLDDGGDACPTVGWQWRDAGERGQILESTWQSNGMAAGLFIKSRSPQNLAAFSQGAILFDARVTSGSARLAMKIDCVWPCTSGDFLTNANLTSEWQTFSIAIPQLVNGGLDLTTVDTGLVFWPVNHQGTTVEIDRVRWISASNAEDANPDPPPDSNTDNNGPESPLRYDGFDLVWSDEFSGTRLDDRYWNHNIGTGSGGWGNNEWQYYRSNNTSVANGFLTITAREENYGGQNYTSSRIKTEGLVDFTYGRVDIRAKLPRGQGIWPALWALGSNFAEVGWPYSGEIDIMEMIGGSGREDTVHGTVHWNVGGLNAPYSHAYIGGAYYGSDFSAGFNVFSIIRTADGIEWRVNDAPYYRFDIDESASRAPFRKPFFLIFNVAVGGNWPGYPDETTSFPQKMIVDYVRIFEPSGIAPPKDSDGDGLSDVEEKSLGTDAQIADSDGDGLNDGDELSAGTDPLNYDSDGDGISDGAEITAGTDPLSADTGATDHSRGTLEVPAEGAVMSGISLFSGWHCDAKEVTVVIDGATHLRAGYGTEREDTRSICDDSNNGFGLLFNFGLLNSGTHTAIIRADGVEFDRVTFSTTQLSTGSFTNGLEARVIVNDFPQTGHTTTLTWDQALQNFAISKETGPAAGGQRYRPNH